MSDVLKRRLRCAVYTRKSTDEGLDQEYNSIDAQRDAGHAYIASQRAEGWIPVADDYDDPAYSGGNMDRPALKRLLADIEAGKVDVVVIYKIDRLTRSLADFSKMVEVFERYGVSFVSITQQFNTTTSMGRLMLNILLSFAQFEREVTGERIRDKIAASKRKGMWMGGVPPLGYDVENRRLVPNPAEAKLVRHIFRRFVELGSSTTLVKELKLDGATSKAWTTQDGRQRAGKPIDKALIYKLLHNRTYLGELRHKEQWYPGEHAPLIDQELWDQVHAILATNARVRGNATRAAVPYLLKGLVFGNDGRALSPFHTTKKNGRRYRYYIPQRDAKEHAGASGLPRLPAAELESAVLDQLRAILRSPALVGEVLPRAHRPRSRPRRGQGHGGHDPARRDLGPALPGRADPDRQAPGGEGHRLADGPGGAPARQRDRAAGAGAAAGHGRCAGGSMSDTRIQQTGEPDVVEASDGRLTLSVPIQIKRRSGRKLVTLPNGEAEPARPWDTAPTPLQLALARGHRWLAMLTSGEVKSLREIARREGVDSSYVSRMVNLTTLAPDIVAAILDDALPSHITLFDLAVDPPVLWEEQRGRLTAR